MHVRASALPSLGFLSGLRVESAVATGPLRWIRICGRPGGPQAELLHEALASGRTSVTEVSEGGAVDWVRVDHNGHVPLLLLDGEHVIGAKQNRMFNASFLVAPGQTVDLPVSCVERGRWAEGPSAFEATDATVASATRAAKLHMLKASLQSGRGHHCDQYEVWREVEAFLGRADTRSPTGAYHHGFQKRQAEADHSLALLEPKPEQVGLAAVRRGAVLVSADVFGSASLYDRGWKKVARGLLVEVYRGGSAPDEQTAIAAVEEALSALAAVDPTKVVAPGMGQTVYASAGAVTFSGIADGLDFYHGVCVPTTVDPTGSKRVSPLSTSAR